MFDKHKENYYIRTLFFLQENNLHLIAFCYICNLVLKIKPNNNANKTLFRES